MHLKQLNLNNFRNYAKSEFKFTKESALIVGLNATGKTNFIEAIYFLAFGKSNKTDRDENSIRFGEGIARVKGAFDSTELEVMLTNGELTGKDNFKKKYLVNGVSKKRADFMGNLYCVLFAPTDLEIVIGSPHYRREFLDEVLSQVDKEYRLAQISFEKGLRQRNALLQKVREFGARNEKEFNYWDDLLIEDGLIITKKRGELIDFMNNSKKEIFDFIIVYDKSIISKERLLQYKNAEVGAGVTLVGPHRDDFVVSMFDKKSTRDVRIFGSRGQQRLVVLQLKLLQLLYMEKTLGFRPLLLLDDIFSELDEGHINLVLESTLLRQGYGGQGQTIMTTTHKEFIPKRLSEGLNVIELDSK